MALSACSGQESDYVSPNAGKLVAPHMVRLDPARISPSDARRDARLALYRGDKSLLGTGEMNPSSVPGAPAAWHEEDWRFGVRTIEDTRDGTRDQAHSAFRNQAIRYAAAYNRVILTEEPPPKYRRRHGDPIGRALINAGNPRPGRCHDEVHLRFGFLNARQARAEARRLHATGKHVLLGVYRYSEVFPGASRADADRLGCLMIAGTSDYFPDDGGFNQAAGDYADAWNTEMLRLTARPPRN